MLRIRYTALLAFVWWMSCLGSGLALEVRALLLVPGGLIVKLHPMSGETVGDAIEIGARGLSAPLKPDTRNFSLVSVDANQESGYRKVAKVNLPERGNEFIILLEPDGATFKVHVVNSREPRFKEDCLLFFNAADITLAATLGPNKVLIKPRLPTIAKPPSRGEKPYYQVTMYQPDHGSARPYEKTLWTHRDISRCYIFLYRGS
ncbi:MAG: hypothetical protein ACO3RV_03285, partial [Luteolibacter sp.]